MIFLLSYLKKLLKQFEGSILPFFQSILKDTEQSHTLAALRDTLLTKLISGEVRVPVDEGERTTTEQTQARRW